ncbi:serine/threonine-protein kinase [Actinoplanes sp. M2I2]|uniref:serine/threonine-protein kinase n=1 Tax=Actinoplanes sp. M2I2 TaxID=1734444 RepID=UPI0020201F6D|nr:serine/threonine-protein kinase [Actinoplanes sp. M2I2]
MPLIAGRYRLGRTLGIGGMGKVWHARDEVLQRDVAIKEVLLPDDLVARDRETVNRRTLREARAAARLGHPNVVQVFDVFEVDGRPWIVMAYVPSRSLHEVLKESGPLEPRRVARIGLALLAALRAAHNAGVDHRDVKPANVLLADDGRVLLTDFGIATIEGDSQISSSDMLIGSPEFMSPERARHGTAGMASDLWSLGATLYAAVEGRSPFHRTSALATLTALATDEPDAPRQAGPLIPVLEGLLRRDPDERLDATAAEHLLREAATGAYGHALVPVRGETATTDALPAAPYVEDPAPVRDAAADGQNPAAAPAAAAAAASAGSALAGSAPAEPAATDGSASADDRAGAPAHADKPPADSSAADSSAPGPIAAGSVGAGASAAGSNGAGSVAGGSAVAGSPGADSSAADLSSASSAAAVAPHADGGAPAAARADGAAPAAARAHGAAPAAAHADGAAPAAAQTGAEPSAPEQSGGASPGRSGEAAVSPDGFSARAGVGTAASVGVDSSLPATGGVAQPPAAAGAPSGSPAVAPGAASALSGVGAGRVPAQRSPSTVDSDVPGTPEPAPPPGPVMPPPAAAFAPGQASPTSDPASPRPGQNGSDPHRGRAKPVPADVEGKPRPSSARRWLLVASAVVAVLVGAIFWGVTRNGSDGEANTGAGDPAATAPGPQSTASEAPAATPSSPSGASASAGAPPTSAASTPKPSPTGADGGTGSGSGVPELPNGWRDYRDSTGFAVYVPEGWTRSKEGSIVYFRDGRTGRVLGIDQTKKPAPNPVADWRGKADYRVSRGDFPSYREIHIRSTDYFQKAADWEFTFSRSGVRQHVNNRGVITSKTQAYGFYWQTRDADWSRYRDDLQLVFDSFRPAT